MKTVKFTLDEELHSKLREAAKAKSQSVSDLVRELLARYLTPENGGEAFAGLLAESYRVMAREHEAVVADYQAAQYMALDSLGDAIASNAISSFNHISR